MATKTRRLGYGLTLNVVLLGAVSLLNDVSSEMILPLLPFFLTIELGASALILGAIEGSGESVASLFRVLSGVHSDRRGRRRPYVFGGYALSSSMKLLYPLTRLWPHFAAFRVAERAGKGLRGPPRDALIVESTPEETRGKAFGFHRSMDTVGALAGPILALVLLGMFAGSYRMVFWFAALPAVAAALLVLAVREVRRPPRPNVRFRPSFAALPVGLRRFVLVATLFALANFSFAFLLLGVTAVEGGNEFLAVLFYLLFNATYVLVAAPAGALSDRVGRRPVLVVGFLAFAGVNLLFLVGQDLVHLVPAFLLYGVSFAFAEGTGQAFASDLAPSSLRATALGAYHAAVGLGKLPASVLAGALWFALGPGALNPTFLYGAVLALAAAVLLSLWTFPGERVTS
jgi:MFS family permease